MEVTSIIFSPTGGTKKVADTVARSLVEQFETLDLSDRAFDGCALGADSVAVIAMPSFGGRAPKVAIDRLKSIRANGAKAIAIAVYGNREQEDTLIEIADAAKGCGFTVVAGIAAVAEHSIAHKYATGRPDVDDTAELERFTAKIAEKLASSDDTEPAIPGDRPYKKAGSGLVPKGSSACTSCGVCAAKCPVGAIDPANVKRTDKNACIGCMRCVAVCPSGARRVSAVMVKAVEGALKKACSERKENTLYL